MVVLLSCNCRSNKTSLPSAVCESFSHGKSCVGEQLREIYTSTFGSSLLLQIVYDYNFVSPELLHSEKQNLIH